MMQNAHPAGSRRIRPDVVRATESLYGPQRAERPSDVHGETVPCPFCPGNEHLTGPSLTADPGPAWLTRVIANRYPAVVEPDGRHEVIVETRDHQAHWPALETACIERILRVYAEREAAGYAAGAAFVTIFKNAGAPAGASLRHPHAQVLALRAIPASIAARVMRLTADCGACGMFSGGSDRLVAEQGDVLAYIPDGSRTAFEVRFAARGHVPRFSSASPATVTYAAALVADVLRRLAAVLGEDLPFNMIVQSAPCDARALSYMHWELELVPRRENFGGFEIGTGGFLVSRPPEDAARLLRAAVAVMDA